MGDPAAGSPLIPQLSDDLSVQIIARLPISSHPDLALVSRSWRSFVRSSLLFTLRSQLGAKEPFICISIRTPTDCSRWFLLVRGHPRHPARFVPLPPPPIPEYGSVCAVLGPSLFVLGPNTAVQIFHPRTNSWTLGPPMAVARHLASSAILHSRLYVIGGCHPSSDPWAEVLDPVSNVWAPVPCPPDLRCETIYESITLGGRIFAWSDFGGVVFDPAAALSWGIMPWVMDVEGHEEGHHAVVNDVLYLESGKVCWYDMAADRWRQVQGVERGLPNMWFNASMTNLGELLCLMWEKNGRGGSEGMEIECAGMKLTRMRDGGFRGSIAWSESALLQVPEGSMLADCVTLEF